MAYIFIYPVIFVLLIGIIILLWINKDLLIKNLVLLIGGGMVGAVIAVIISYALIESKLGSSRLSTLLYIFFPVTCAIVTLQNVKNKAFFDTQEKAILFRKPALVFKSYGLSQIVGLSLSTILLMIILGVDKIAFAFILAMVKIPVGLIATLLVTSFMVDPSRKYGILLSILFGATCSLLLLNNSAFAIPVVCYAIVTPYVLVYLMVLGKSKEITH